MQRYAGSLGNPPLLIVSDTGRIVIRTAFTGMVTETHEIALEDLRGAAARDLLRACFEAPERLRPRKSRADVTEEAARRFAGLAKRLQDRGHDPERVAHFVNRLVFCMFAEDVGLLPDHVFGALMKDVLRDPTIFEDAARDLFAAMNAGGRWGAKRIVRFNGGLFDDDDVLPIDAADARDLHYWAGLDWSQMEPTIFGTLFERGLDPGKRSQLGAHYTDEATIRRIVEPVMIAPLRAEWAAAREKAAARLAANPPARADAAGAPRPLTAAQAKARRAALTAAARAHRAFKERLKGVRVLDPACGSGNFLNVALRELKALELVVDNDAETLGLERGFPEVGPEVVHGIELSPYAAELAGVSVWIADIQWMRENGFEPSTDPVLRPLGTIECRDAVLAPDGARADWPAAEAIIGNPPFLGNKKMVGELGEDYSRRLRAAWPEVPGGADLVAYWVAGAWRAIEAGRAARAGLVTTNSIRGGASREALKPIVAEGRIFEAWSDEPWTVEGAAIRVSIVMFDGANGTGGTSTIGNGDAILNGAAVDRIASNLTASGADVTTSLRLQENYSRSFQGTIKVGSFDLNRTTAEAMLLARGNPNGKPNSDVVKPWINGSDVVRRPADKWIIDFGVKMPQAEAALYELPFEHLRMHVEPMRSQVRRENHRRNWWIHGESRPGLRKAIAPLDRWIVTPRVAKHRLFIWRNGRVLPDARLVVIARDDDTSFGLLHSRFHELWSLATGGWHGVGNDPQYTPTKSFETFPFPEGLTPDVPAANYAADPRAVAIAEAARELDAKREAWLNPPELIRRVPEIVPGYPDRLLPVDDAAAKILAKRTLTNLYNARPAWLAGLHDRLDRAVAAAYGWPDDIAEEDALARLLALNRARAAP